MRRGEREREGASELRSPTKVDAMRGDPRKMYCCDISRIVPAF